MVELSKENFPEGRNVRKESKKGRIVRKKALYNVVRLYMVEMSKRHFPAWGREKMGKGRNDENGNFNGRIVKNSFEKYTFFN